MFDVLASLIAAMAKAPSGPPAGRPSWRQRLAEFVAQRPGQRLSVIWKSLGADRGTARYHLIMLERDNAVRVIHTSGGHAHYFPPTTRPSDLPLLTVLLSGRMLEVANHVLTTPGVGQKELTQGLPMSRKVFRQYANVLIREDLVHEVRDPHGRRYFPRPRLAGLVAQLGPPAGTLGSDGEGRRR